MTTFNWLSLFGVPTIILAIFTTIYKKLAKKLKKTQEENDAIKAGVKALLQDRLYDLYSKCRKEGGATHFERRNWNNLYTQYHNLGGNGEMKDVCDRFFKLPIIDE